MRCGFLFLSLSLFAFPAIADVQTLDEALASAYTHDPGLQAERAKLRATDEQVSQAISGWRPSIDSTSQAGADREMVDELGDSNLKPRSTGVQITQPVFSGFRTINSLHSADATVMAGRAELEDTEQQLLLDTSKAYLDVLQAQQIVQLNCQNESDLQEQLDITRKRFKIGDIRKTDIDQAESRFKVAQVARLQAEGELLNKRVTYSRLTGTMPTILAPVSLTLEQPRSEDEAVHMAEENNPKVIEANYNQQSAKADIKVAEAALMPEISIVGSASTSSDQSVYLPQRDDSLSIVAKLTIPLYRSGSDYSKTRAAEQTSSQRTLEMEDALNKAKETASNAWQTLMTAREVIDGNKEAVDANTKALYGVSQEARVGTRTTLDVLNARQELLNAKISLVKAEHDENVAIMEVKASVGTLTATALHLPVEIYDPKTHYDHVRNKWIGFNIN